MVPQFSTSSLNQKVLVGLFAVWRILHRPIIAKTKVTSLSPSILRCLEFIHSSRERTRDRQRERERTRSTPTMPRQSRGNHGWTWSAAAMVVVARCCLLFGISSPLHAFSSVGTVPYLLQQGRNHRTRLFVLSEPNVHNEKIKVMETKQNRKTGKKITSPSAAKHDDLFLFRSMVDHDILTREKELELGTAVQRSIRLRKKLDLLVEQKRLEQYKQDQRREEEQDRLQWHEEEEGDDEENDHDLSHLSVYGGTPLYSSKHDQELRSLVAREDQLFEERESNSLLSYALDQQQHLDEGSDFWDQRHDDETTTRTTLAFMHVLSDQEIVQQLQVPGGRAELKAILLQGAMARDTLIRSNIRLVVGITKRWARMSSLTQTNTGSLYSLYSGSWDRPSVNEAVQEGILGLATAAERYEPARGLRFATYATHWVTNSIRQCFQRATTGVLRVPTNYYETRSKFRTLVKQYHEREGQVPPLEILANELKISVSRLKIILKLTQPLASMDAPRQPGGVTRAGKSGAETSGSMLISDSVADLEPQPEDRVEFSFLRQCLENAMANELAPYERDVIRLRLGLDDGVSRTCQQVAKEYGGSLTSSEVRSAEKRAFKKLRSPQSLATYKLLHYLDFADVDRESMTLR
jgi:RNA polymerase sigma factor (sigma-70 family)